MSSDASAGRVAAGALTGGAARYAVISTVRNEEDFIRQTAEALLAQTIAPGAWLIVDDGSTDGTARILAGFAERHGWISVLPLGQLRGSNRCSRILRAFFMGYAELEGEFDYVIKMDGDVTFEADHVQRLLAHFEQEERLGIASGTYTEPAGQGWRTHTVPEGYAVGAFRVYRTECLRDIVDAVEPMLAEAGATDAAGAERSKTLTLSWDSIDHLYSEEAGWTTRCFHDLVIVHHRTEGARTHPLRGQFEQGVVSYVMGYHPLFALARGLARVKARPYVLGGLALTLGYLAAAFRTDVVRADERTRRLVRDKQTRRIRRMVGLGSGGNERGD